MKVVLEYLNTLLSELENTRKEKERLLNQKEIEANEIHKVISKLSLNDNSTFNVFNASGTRIEFQNKEVLELKSQEDQLKIEADHLTDEIREINLKIEELAITIGHANSSNNKIVELSKEVVRLNAEVSMYSTGGKKYKDSSDKLKNEIEKNLTQLEQKLNSEDFILPKEPVDSDSEVRLSSTVEPVDIQKDDSSFLQEVADRVYFITKILKFDPVRVNLELDEIYKAIIKYINR